MDLLFLYSATVHLKTKKSCRMNRVRCSEPGKTRKRPIQISLSDLLLFQENYKYILSGRNKENMMPFSTNGGSCQQTSWM